MLHEDRDGIVAATFFLLLDQLGWRAVANGWVTENGPSSLFNVLVQLPLVFHQVLT